MKTEYKQRLPHIQPVGAAFFVTFGLVGSGWEDYYGITYWRCKLNLTDHWWCVRSR